MALFRELQFLVNNMFTDMNGTASYVVRRAPYILRWNPPTTGFYEIKAIAIDNSGMASISEPHTIEVRDPVGQKPVANWHGPIDDRMFESLRICPFTPAITAIGMVTVMDNGYGLHG